MTVILLSDSPESYNNDFVLHKEKKYGKAPITTAKTEHGPIDHIRRKLMFEEEGPEDRLSTANKGRTYYVCRDDGKMTKKVEHAPLNTSVSRRNPTTGHPKSPQYDTDSNGPIMWWRMPVSRRFDPPTDWHAPW